MRPHPSEGGGGSPLQTDGRGGGLKGGTREGRTTVVVNYASGNLASGIQTTYLP
eukprot:COSAG05_NODE_22592_length_264_cov_0.527273_1_plen_53_part_10